MSKKKNKKKETLLAETVEMQKKQAMNLVTQSNVNQQLLEEVIGIKEEMDRNVKKTNQKLTDIELLVEEVNKKSPYRRRRGNQNQEYCFSKSWSVC